MSGTDKDGEDDKTRQADWINDEGEMQDNVPLPSPLGAYRSPLDETAPKAADPSPPPFDPEGPGRLGDAPLAEFIEELNQLMFSTNESMEDELKEVLGAKIDKYQSEMLAQIALHTAALNQLSDNSGVEARTKEIRAFAEEAVRDLDLVAKRLDGTVRSSTATSRDLSNQINHAKEVQ
ncbi:MAG: hypothetical protein P8Q48_20435 [Paracoccaceae bacterium]|nr:hypothetical protein [Paracoccaceae bacterium]